MPAADSSPTPSRVGTMFDSKMEKIRVSKADMNLTILDYFISKGYPESAKKFAMEANMDPVPDIDLITRRVTIRRAIYAGDIQKAIEEINEYNPQLLDADQELHFDLLCLQLIELIRAADPNSRADLQPVFDFAESNLAPRAMTNPRFLADLEKAMALLIFPRKDLKPMLAELLDPSKRENVADKVNSALLQGDGEKTQPTLDALVSLRAYAEQRARLERPNMVPEELRLGLDPPASGKGLYADGSNGSNEMATN